MKKNLVSYLVYISLVFLLITLLRKEYIVFPETIHVTYLGLSFITLFLGFIFQGLSYKVLLKNHGYFITARDAIISYGLPVFGRYIPGKFWVHLGRASYINKHYGYPFNEITYISLSSQFIGIWIVILFCSVVLVMANISLMLKLLVLVLWVALTLIIFTSYFHQLFSWLVFKIRKKKVQVPILSFRENLRVFPVFILFWGLYGVSFYLLSLSMYAQVSPLTISFFPLSAVIGIAALFAPGGLGAREAVLTGLLKLDSIGLVLATSISVFSRVWFLVGESFIFALAMILKVLRKPKTPIAR